MSKLRTGNNKLPITEGRYQNINREDRVCNKCDENCIGDEYHVLFNCQNENIVRLRNKYIPRYYRTRPSQLKFVMFMQNTSLNVLNNLALFLNSVLKMFR